MKNVTFSAKEELIEQARHVAAEQHSTLNEMFREWLENVAKRRSQNEDVASKFDALWQQTGYLHVGKKLSREEMNER